MDGTENFTTCMEDIISTFDCPKKCSSFYLSSVLTLPPCSSLDEYICVGRKLYLSENVKKMYDCHKPKYAKLYMPRANPWQRSGKPNVTQLYFYFESLVVLHKDENYVIGDGQLIGSIGGSLGLFMGFSFYSYISTALNALINKLYKVQNK